MHATDPLGGTCGCICGYGVGVGLQSRPVHFVPLQLRGGLFSVVPSLTVLPQPQPHAVGAHASAHVDSN